MSPAEEERRKRRRQKNKLAAEKCRQRKRTAQGQLEQVGGLKSKTISTFGINATNILFSFALGEVKGQTET